MMKTSLSLMMVRSRSEWRHSTCSKLSCIAYRFLAWRTRDAEAFPFYTREDVDGTMPRSAALVSLVNDGREMVVVYRREEGSLRVTRQGELSVDIHMISGKRRPEDKERRNELLQRMCEQISGLPFEELDDTSITVRE